MRRLAILFAAGASLAGMSAATAAPTWYIGNDTTSGGATLFSSPNSHATYTNWYNSLPTLDHIAGDISGLTLGTIPGGGVTVPFGSVVDATITAVGTINNSIGLNGHYAANNPNTGIHLRIPTSSLSIQFTQQIFGFSFYLTDLGDTATVQTTMELYKNGALVGSKQITCGVVPCVPLSLTAQNAAISFVGVSDPIGTFDEVLFTSTGSDTVAISDLMIEAPEPASLVLFGAGLVALATTRRRGRK